MRNNAELQRDVLDELLWDPSINAANVQVAANDGGVTLNGSIGSYTEMHAAERYASGVGVNAPQTRHIRQVELRQ
jgi:osmotically-inducible protein OsmY